MQNYILPVWKSFFFISMLNYAVSYLKQKTKCLKNKTLQNILNTSNFYNSDTGENKRRDNIMKPIHCFGA